MARYQEGRQVFDFDESVSLGSSNYKPPIRPNNSPYYGEPDHRPKNRPYEYPTSRKYPGPAVYHQSVIAQTQSRKQAVALEEANKNKCRCTRGLVIGLVVAAFIVILAVVLATLALMGVIFNYTAPPDNFPETPPMGWRSDGAFFCDALSQSVVQATATSLINLGYRDAGYDLIILDDCWQSKRNSSGVLTPDLSKFPAGNIGMRNLARNLKNQRISMGFSTSVGTLSCQRRPGGHHLQSRDMRIYEDWEARYVHADDCFLHPSTRRQEAYAELGDNLALLPQPVVYSASSRVGLPAVKDTTHVARLRDYIQDDWYEMIAVVDAAIADGTSAQSRPGFWVDVGPMSVGMSGMTHEQYVTHFSLWCALKMPLIMANDVSKANDFEVKDLLQNDEMIAISQDYMGQPADRVSHRRVTPQSRFHANLVVTSSCDSVDPAQQWEIQEFGSFPTEYRRFFNQGREMCIGYDENKIVVMRPCFDTDLTIRWTLGNRDTYNQTHPFESEDDCLTSSTTPRVAARVRSCGERAMTRDWQGDNQWWHGFNDDTSMVPVGGQTNPQMYNIRNSNNQCLTVGIEEYWDIYSGPLSGNRVLVMLVNRDDQSHHMRLGWDDVPLLDPTRSYSIRDVRGKNDLGIFTGNFMHRVLGHSTLTLTLTLL